MRPWKESAAWSALAVLLAAAAYEGLVALEIVPLGSEPGAGPRFEDTVVVAALLASLVATVVACAHALEERCFTRPVWVALAPAGFAFLLARWLTFDPYYLPSLRRYAEGEIHATWIVLVGAASLAAALASWRLPRLGSGLSAVVLVLSALTAWILPIGK